MRGTALAALAFAAAVSVGHAQTPPTPPPPPAPGLPTANAETRAAARELIEVSGASKMVPQMFTLVRRLMVANVRQGSGKTAEEAAKIVDKVLMPEMKAQTGELIGLVTELYAANYTVDEMKQLTAFYRSPLGQRMIEVTPKITQESIAAGQAWGQKVARDAIQKHAEELRRRGVTL